MLRGKVDGVGADERSGTAHPRTDPRLRDGTPDRLPGRPRSGDRCPPRRTAARVSDRGGGGGVIAFQTTSASTARSRRCSPTSPTRATSPPGTRPSKTSPDLHRSERPWLDVHDETAATDRCRNQPARDRDARSSMRVRDPHDGGTDPVPLPLPLRCRERRDDRATRRPGRTRRDRGSHAASSHGVAVKRGVDDNLATLKLILEQRHARGKARR